MSEVNCMINRNRRPRVNDDILWRKDGEDDELVVLASCLGVAIALSAFLGFAGKFFLPLGVVFFVGGILMIVLSGCRSIRDITSKSKE